MALLPWQLVSSGVFAASESVVRGQDLVKQVYFPRILIPLAPFAVALVDFCAAFAVALVWIVVASPPLTLAIAWCRCSFFLRSSQRLASAAGSRRSTSASATCS